MKRIRIFLSSPGDVPAERELVRKLVKEKLPVDPFLRDRVHFELVSWDDPDAPANFPAHLTPQLAIDRGLPSPSECDIVIVVIWSRLGTILPDSERKADGSRYRSGTEWEYLDALDAARKHNTPSILIYRNIQVPTMPLTASESERSAAFAQWKSVEEFFEQFRAADGSITGGTHQYSDLLELEQKLAHHIRTEVSRLLDLASKEEGRHTVDIANIFAPPRFDSAVPRTEVVRSLATLHEESSVLVITGLSGNGKSFIASQLAHVLLQDKAIDSALWIECELGESLESLFTQISRSLPIAAQSPKARCREVIALLRQRNAILILDDYHACDRATMEPLLEAAARAGSPARLVLVSRVLPEEAVALPDVSVRAVRDFTSEEASALLRKRGVPDLEEAVRRDLLVKTGALPLAMALFCGLVKLGRQPQQLLDGDLLEQERLKRWFDSLAEMLSPRALRLLGLLSLVDGVFDDSVIKMFSIGKADAEIRRDFGGLQSAYLVERDDQNRWRMHDLVGSIGRTSLPPGTVRSTYAELAGHYRAMASQAKRARNEDQHLECLIKACRAFDRSTIRDEQLERALEDLARIVKVRGAHVLFLELAKNLVLVRGASNPWLHYHFAHCCQVLGLYDDAMEHSRRILQLSRKVPPTLRLSASRLYAEALGALGQVDKARETLISALDAVRREDLEPTSIAQAESLLAGLETKLNLSSSAHRRISDLLARARSEQNSMGEAVALARMGYFQLKLSQWRDAEEYFDQSCTLFRQARDPRGESWTLLGMALAAMGKGDELRCEGLFVQAAALWESIGSQDPEYDASIADLIERATQASLIALLEKERGRLESLRGERRSFALRLKGH